MYFKMLRRHTNEAEDILLKLSESMDLRLEESPDDISMAVSGPALWLARPMS